MRASLVVVALLWAGCSFPSDGVLLEGSGPDAEVVPPDACVPVDEVCNGVDDDCDSNTDEGVASNLPCDGPDADLCLDDVMICDSSGAEVCAPGDDNAELCNAADDDCDNVMDEGFALDVDCDGADGDACNEGKTICAGDGLGTTCNDMTDTIAEVCNHADDDCDTLIDDGFDFNTDESNCGSCNNTCTNANGVTSCEAPGVCTPLCTNGYADCNGDPDDGCDTLQNTITSIATACLSTGTTADITVNGDVAGTPVEFKGTTERLLRVHLVESSMGGGGVTAPVTASLALVSGAGTHYDLFVYCPTCGLNPISDASDNVVEVGRDDAAGDRSYDVYAEIRYNTGTPSTTCAQWTLTVTGAVATANRCGN